MIWNCLICLFFGVCCSSSNVYSHSLRESTPAMHCMDLMHHVSYSLWANGGRQKKVDLWILTSPLVLIRLEFSDVDVFLLFHVSLVVTKAQHAFHQQSHCVNYKHEEHCTSLAEGFHRVNTGFWCANRWAAWLRGFIFMTLLRDQDWGLKEMYIMCIRSVLYSQVKIRMYIHHLMDGCEGWYMNISTVSASSSGELTFAVEIKNRLLGSFLPFTSSSLFIHTTQRTHRQMTHILLQAVQSGVRHIIKKKEERGMASFICAFCLYSE